MIGVIKVSVVELGANVPVPLPCVNPPRIDGNLRQVWDNMSNWKHMAPSY